MKRSIIGLLIISLMSTQAMGRSIEDINPRRLPKVGITKRLVLSGRGFDSLEGLGAIRGIENARIINLANNELSTIEEGALVSAKKLRGLNLSNNQLTGEGLRGLRGLDNLQVLILDSNNIETIPAAVLKGLPRLKVIIIRNNPISGQSVKQLRTDGYVVYTLPMVLTGANIKRALLVTGAIAAVVLGALAAQEGYKAGKVYVQNQALADILEASAQADEAKANGLRAEIARIGSERFTPEIVRQPLEWHANFLEQQAEAKRRGVMFARNGNMAGLQTLLRDSASAIQREIGFQEQQLQEARGSLTTPAAVGNNIADYLRSLNEQKEHIESLLVQFSQEELQAEEAAEEERQQKVEEARQRGREMREAMRKKYNLPG
jgi:hypothetical protein